MNKSAHFCGVAEMVGPVDFGATSEFWDWKDKFPVKWHMIKDVPFSQIGHITLENNENRSIICSRDSQQVEKEEGEEMLNIFKNYNSTTSLLDEIALLRRVDALVRRPPSPSPTQQDQHEQQQQEGEEETAAASSSSSRNSNNNAKEETDNNTEETDNHTPEVETDQNNGLDSKCEEIQVTESTVTVIGVTNHSPSNNKKQEEEEANIYKLGESECEGSHETQSTVISVGSHSSASNDNSTRK